MIMFETPQAGEILIEEFMVSTNLMVTSLAEALGISLKYPS